MFSLKLVTENISDKNINQKKCNKFLISLINFLLTLQPKAFTELMATEDEFSPRKQMDQKIALSTASGFMGMLRVRLVQQRENKNPVCFCF